MTENNNKSWEGSGQQTHMANVTLTFEFVGFYCSI